MTQSRTTIVSLITLCFLIFMIGCKKKEEANNTSSDVTTKLTTNLTVMHNAVSVYNDALQSGDSLTAVNAMRSWLAENSEVKGGWVHNREFLEIEFNNGLKSSINIISIGENGEHIRRGGGNDKTLTSFSFNSDETQNIKNKKALVLIPYPFEFGYGSDKIEALRSAIEAKDIGVSADIQVGKDVTLSDLDKLGAYGLIILDVHGVNYGFFLEYVNRNFDPADNIDVEAVIDAVVNEHNIPKDKIENGQIEIGLHIAISKDGTVSFQYTILITEEYIRQLNVDLSDAVLFGNHCYSGYTASGKLKYNLPEAWRSKGLATIYGYAGSDGTSAGVDNIFCREREISLLKSLVTDGDTTGEAHLDANNKEYFNLLPAGFRKNRAAMLTQLGDPPPGWPLYLKQFFDKNYKYETCGEDFVDERDETTYKTVCIGDQVWMAENLRYLPQVNNVDEFKDAVNSKQPAFGVSGYDGNDVTTAKTHQNYKTYGAYYNWWAVMAGEKSSNTNPSGVQGICPKNWHIPSKAEWTQLIDHLGGISSAGGKLKEEGTMHWIDPNTGATNESGFTALPAGAYHIPGFNDLTTKTAYFISSTTDTASTDAATDIWLSYDANWASINRQGKAIGHSCRCVKD